MTKLPPHEPWLHEASGFWCKKLAGKLHYLARDYKAAKRRLRQLLDAIAREESATRDWLEAPISTLADEFLTDIKARRAFGTYRNYREQLLRAMEIFGPAVPVGSLRRFHLSKVEQQMTIDGFSPSTTRDTIAVVQSVFNWAVRNDLLEHSPLVGFQKPRGGGRNRLITPEEFQSLLRNSDIFFRRFLLALRFTGCRPGEVRGLTWEMVHFDTRLWVIPKHKTVTMQREPAPRVIPLPEPIFKMCRRLAETPHAATDHVFLNMKGWAYTKDCVVRKMARLRKKAGIEAKSGETVVLYTNRHTFATNAIGKVADTELAELMGHTTTRTLRRYVHLDAGRLHEIQRRAQG